MKAWFKSLAVFLVALACSSSEAVSSSRQPLTSEAQANYSNTPSGSDHFATTAAVTVPDPSCGGSVSVRTTVAWEEEQAESSDLPVAPIWIATQCGFNPINVSGGAAVPLTTALTGVPPEWVSRFGGAPMYYMKEPVLLPISQFENQSWIVMLAEVSDTNLGGAYRSIAIVLSLDGGQTWTAPHLVQNDLTSGIYYGLDDLAAANSFRPDFETNMNSHICPTSAPTCTDDVFVTWTFNGNRFYNFVSYYQDPNYNWQLAYNPVAVPPTYPAINLGSTSPFNAWPGTKLLNFAIVAGEWAPQGSNLYPFVMVEWPENPLLDNGEPTLSVDCSTGGTTMAQDWRVAVSTDLGNTWNVGVPSPQTLHSVSNWPTCVGFLAGDANYRNPARPSLSYDPGSNSVIDAVAIPDPNASEVPGTVIESDAIQFQTAPVPNAAVLAFRSTHTTSEPQQDQFLGTVKGQEQASPLNGIVSLTWVDSVDDTSMQNQPFGIYGTNQNAFNPAAPTFTQTCSGGSFTNCWYATSRAWPVPPAPPALLGVPINNGFDWDVLGRHQAISTESGWSFFVFGGDTGRFTHTVSFAPL